MILLFSTLEHRLKLATEIVRIAYMELDKDPATPLLVSDFHDMYHRSTVAEYVYFPCQLPIAA